MYEYSAGIYKNIKKFKKITVNINLSLGTNLNFFLLKILKKIIKITNDATTPYT